MKLSVKWFVFTLLILLSATFVAYRSVSSNDQSVQAPDSLFIVHYTVGKNWDVKKPPHDQAYFKFHSAHLSALRKNGVIKMGARYSEVGMIIIQGRNKQEAQKVISADSAVINQTFEAELNVLRPFYKGCLE